MPSMEELENREDDFWYRKAHQYDQDSEELAAKKTTCKRPKQKEICLESILIGICSKYGKILREYAFAPVDYRFKHADDPVTVLDKTVEGGIMEEFGKFQPTNFVGEETGITDNGSDLTVYIDPIDGTKSFMKGEFNSSISVAVEEKGVLTAGCVYDFMRDIIYLRKGNRLRKIYRGKTVLKERRASFSGVRIIADGQGSDLRRLTENFPDLTVKENSGSIALAMALTASGAYDGLVNFGHNKGHAWDVAAGYYLLSEQFIISDIDGKEFDFKQPYNGMIAVRKDCEDMQKIINAALGKETAAKQ